MISEIDKCLIETNKIFTNINSVIDLYNDQKKILTEKEKENKELIKRVKELENELINAQTKYNNIRVGKAIETTDTKTIDKLIREIDNCISLINN